MKMLVTIFVLMLASIVRNSVGSADYTLDLGLVAQGPEVEVYVEGKPITISQPIVGLSATGVVDEGGVRKTVIKAFSKKLRTLMKAHMFNYNVNTLKNPFVTKANAIVEDMIEQLSVLGGLIFRDEVFRKFSKKTLKIATSEEEERKFPCVNPIITAIYNSDIETAYKIIRSVTNDNNAFMAKFETKVTNGVTTYTTTNAEPTLTSTCEDIATEINQAGEIVRDCLNRIKLYMEWVETSVSFKLHPELMTYMGSNLRCHNQTGPEEMVVAGVEHFSDGYVVNYTTIPYTKVGGHHELYAIPYMVEGTPYVIDIHGSKIADRASGKVLDHSRCTKTGHTYRCVPGYLTTDTCVQHALDSILEVPEKCKIIKLEPDSTPLIVDTELGTLIAQRSDDPVLISHGSRRIREDPVIVRGPDSIVISYAQGRKTIPGQANATFAVHASPLSKSARKSIYFKHGFNYIYKLIPDSYTDVLYLSLATGQLVLLIPMVWKLVKFFLRCCGINWDERPPTWLRRVREWEVPVRHAPHRPRAIAPCEEIPLQNMGCDSTDDYFAVMVRTAKSLSLERFLAKYKGDRDDLTDFYSRVNGIRDSRGKGVAFKEGATFY